MKLTNFSMLIALISTLGGCVSATVADNNICDSKQITFSVPTLPTLPDAGLPTGLPTTYPLPSISQTTTFDFSNSLSKIDDVASNLSVAVNLLTVDNSSGEFDWVQSVKIQIEGNTIDTPLATLATYNSADGGASTELNVQVEMSPSIILNYLKNGPVILTFTIASSMVSVDTVRLLEMLNGQIATSVNMCVAVSGSFNKKL